MFFIKLLQFKMITKTFNLNNDKLNKVSIPV